MMDKFRQEKVDFLLDQIRRVIANPGNAQRVAEAISKDWNPTVYISPDGKSSFKLSEE